MNFFYMRLFLLTFSFLALCPAWAGADNPKVETLNEPARHELFSEANRFFQEAVNLPGGQEAEADQLYRKALLRYEKLVDAGVENSKIYYNIGNTYFRLNDIGNAILNYRRAEQLNPNDPNITQNLNYALTKKKDRIEEKEEEKIMKTLFFWHYDLSMPVRLTLFTIFYLGFWALALLRLTPLAMPRWPLATTCILFLLFGASIGIDRTLGNEKHGVLTSPEIVARKGDSMTYQPSFTEPLHAGTEFTLIEKRTAWLYIELADGRRCWVPSDSSALLWKNAG